MQSSVQRDIFQVSLLKFYEKAKKKTLVSENADDEKNLHPGGRKKKFFDEFN